MASLPRAIADPPARIFASLTPISYSLALRTVYLVFSHFCHILFLPKTVNSLKADTEFSSLSCPLRTSSLCNSFFIYNKNCMHFFLRRETNNPKISVAYNSKDLFLTHVTWRLWLALGLLYGFQAERATPNITFSWLSPTSNHSFFFKTSLLEYNCFTMVC